MVLYKNLSRLANAENILEKHKTIHKILRETNKNFPRCPINYLIVLEAGICNIIEYAIKVTGVNCVKSVIGGFHLKENNFQTKETIKFIKNKGIQKVYPSHCTDFPALVAFFEEFQSVQLKTGMVLNF